MTNMYSRKTSSDSNRSAIEKSTNQSLGIVLSDVWGPILSESLTRCKYFVTFIDDYLRYWEVFFSQNAEVCEAFKNYNAALENFTGHKKKKLQSDNGKNIKSDPR